MYANIERMKGVLGNKSELVAAMAEEAGLSKKDAEAASKIPAYKAGKALKYAVE